ncbi:MAG: hypothetical protein J0L75_16330, partial [Spirochaetes bacterium]|nr:hypothetical protein [Spirochaetota bacterium]
TAGTSLWLGFTNATSVTWTVFAKDTTNQITWAATTNTLSITNTNGGADLTPPSAAVPMLPADNASIGLTNQTFYWSQATDNVGVASYQLFLTTNSAIWRAYSNLATTNYLVSNLAGFSNTNLRWYVKALDAALNQSVSATNRLAWNVPTGADLPPTPPNLVSPANFSSLSNTNGVTFTWAASTDDIALSNYTLVARTNGGAWTSNVYPTNATSAYLTFSFISNTGVQWYVFARDSANQLAFSAATNTVLLTNTAPDATPPSAPVLLSPAQGATATATNQAFLWAASTDNVGVSAYALVLLTNGAAFQQFSNLAATNQAASVAAGFSNASLSWYVRAFDAAGNSAVSATNAFSWFVPAAAAPVTNAAGGTFTLLTPAANGVVASNIDRVAFAWRPAPGSAFDNYQIAVIIYSNGVQRFVCSNTLAETSVLLDLSGATNGIASNTIHLDWVVNGIDASGKSLYLARAGFTLVPPPQPGKGDIRPLLQDPVGQVILGTQSNSVAVLEYMASKTNTVVPPIYNGEEVPVKYKVDPRTGAPLSARVIRVYDRRGRLIFEKPAPRGTFAAWDKKDRQNRPVPAGMYVLEIVYEDGSSEKAMTVVPK